MVSKTISRGFDSHRRCQSGGSVAGGTPGCGPGRIGSSPYPLTSNGESPSGKARGFGPRIGGSSPSSPARAGSSAVERLPLKQHVVGSIPTRLSIQGRVVQGSERLGDIEEVAGSNPASPTSAHSSEDRAADFGSVGREFESLWARHGARSSAAEPVPFKHLVGGSNPPGLTKTRNAAQPYGRCLLDSENTKRDWPRRKLQWNGGSVMRVNSAENSFYRIHATHAIVIA